MRAIHRTEEKKTATNPPDPARPYRRDPHLLYNEFGHGRRPGNFHRAKSRRKRWVALVALLFISQTAAPQEPDLGSLPLPENRAALVCQSSLAQFGAPREDRQKPDSQQPRRPRNCRAKRPTIASLIVAGILVKKRRKHGAGHGVFNGAAA